jgi:hypothetical protein
LLNLAGVWLFFLAGIDKALGNLIDAFLLKADLEEDKRFPYKILWKIV